MHCSKAVQDRKGQKYIVFKCNDFCWSPYTFVCRRKCGSHWWVWPSSHFCWLEGCHSTILWFPFFVVWAPSSFLVLYLKVWVWVWDWQLWFRLSLASSTNVLYISVHKCTVQLGNTWCYSVSNKLNGTHTCMAGLCFCTVDLWPSPWSVAWELTTSKTLLSGIGLGV